jgi:hypothetical protein
MKRIASKKHNSNNKNQRKRSVSREPEGKGTAARQTEEERNGLQSCFTILHVNLS